MTLPARLDVEMPGGYEAVLAFTLTDASGNPLNIAGFTWEMVVRDDPTDTTTPALVTITTTVNSQGVITTSTGSATVVTATLYPAASTGLAPGVYAYALVSNPGTTTSTPQRFGRLTVTPVAAP